MAARKHFTVKYHARKHSKTSVLLKREECPRCGIFMDVVKELLRNDGDSETHMMWKCRRCRRSWLK